jgi:hypothetical protein
MRAMGDEDRTQEQLEAAAFDRRLFSVYGTDGSSSVDRQRPQLAAAHSIGESIERSRRWIAEINATAAHKGAARR